jgi:hypothetical protein
MEEDSKKPLSDYTFEEYQELTDEEREHLANEATEEEVDRWHDKYEKELLDDYINKTEEIRSGGKQGIIIRNAMILFFIALFIWCIPDLIAFLSK